MTRGIFFLLALSTLFSQAHGGSRELTRIESLETKVRNSLRPALDASFHFHMDAGVDCTGTFISNSGHFITALHCIAGCLTKRQAVRREIAIDDAGANDRSFGPPTYKITVDDERVSEGVNCPGTISGVRSEMRVLYTGGRGWLSPKASLAVFSKRFPEEYKALLDEGYEHAGDFAIVQAIDTRPAACLTLAPAPQVGARLQAVSFPCLRREGIEAKGQTPFYTAGERTSGFKESDYFKKFGAKRIDFDVASVERPETFFSSLDIEKCGSGTALLDDAFNVVGVATRVYKSSTRYERGSLEAIDVAHILQELKKRRPEEMKAFESCAKPSSQAGNESSRPEGLSY